jgi:hypothetical protein
MGYTHYWEILPTVSLKKHEEALDLIGEFISKHKGALASPGGARGSKPTNNEKGVGFNGIEEDGHDSFYLPRNLEEKRLLSSDDAFYSDFCKTASKLPYDDFVVASLCIYKYIVKDDVIVYSDGKLNEGDFDDGMALASEFLLRKVNFKELGIIFTPDEDLDELE